MTTERTARPRRKNSPVMGDESRLMRGDTDLANAAGRGTPGADEDAERTSSDGTVMTDEERIALIRSEFQHEALPSVPQVAGWHFCWLTTNSSYDSLQKRLRIGYELVKVSDLQGIFDAERMSHLTSAGGTNSAFPGCVTWNEMILARLPQKIYQAVMTEFHHKMPNEEEEKIRDQVRRLTTEGDEDSEGTQLGHIEGDGFDKMLKGDPRVRRPPAF